MINTTNLKVDEEKEVPIVKKKPKKSNNPMPPYVKVKGRQGLKGKISNKLKKKIKHLDKHHINVATNLIHKLELYKQPITSSINRIPKLCRHCSKCVRSVNYCSVFETNCTVLNSKTCSIKTPL